MYASLGISISTYIRRLSSSPRVSSLYNQHFFANFQPLFRTLAARRNGVMLADTASVWSSEGMPLNCTLRKKKRLLRKRPQA